MVRLWFPVQRANRAIVQGLGLPASLWELHGTPIADIRRVLVVIECCRMGERRQSLPGQDSSCLKFSLDQKRAARAVGRGEDGAGSTLPDMRAVAGGAMLSASPTEPQLICSDIIL